MMTQTYRKIEYYLYNYQYIDIKIKEIKSNMSDSEYNHNYQKYIKNKSSSLEDLVIRNIDSEQRVYKLEKWKKLITFVLEWYKQTNIMNYRFIKLKYFKCANSKEIQEELNISLKVQKDIRAEILQYIFLIAIKQEMLKEVNY